MLQTVLSIAGSDPTGGAGLQADIKTLTVLGVYAAAAVTCITVQNSRGVSRIEPLAPGLVVDQIDAVLADHQVDRIKIGMIGTGEIARAVGDRLCSFTGEVVLDPVLAATTGQGLMDGKGMADYLNHLLPRATVLTPNLPELAALSATRVGDEQSCAAAAERILAGSARLRAVLVKGGHGGTKGHMTDYLMYRKNQNLEWISITHPVIDSRNTHGTGCTLASAFTAYLCQGAGYVEAFSGSVEFLQQQLAKGRDISIVNNPDGAGGLPLHLPDSERA